MLEISRLSLSLGQQTLLRDLSLTLHPGQVHVIIGPNGTGKTSLMRTLFGELTPDSGDIRLGDQSARQMTQARWRQQFGYMPQNIQLELDLSVIEVVVLGDSTASPCASRTRTSWLPAAPCRRSGSPIWRIAPSTP
ncbi:ATP-binding cassette domain-containing protein [Aeromonas caviae]|uniref:ATP-binding cassette domain-containing protein n=1 Tax=Aeromonas caviae TaxID=648 RepID=UPI003EC4CA5C